MSSYRNNVGIPQCGSSHKIDLILQPHSLNVFHSHIDMIWLAHSLTWR